MKSLGLYIHIPFCPYRCHYCDFLIFTGKQEQIPHYIDRLAADIEKSGKEHPEYRVNSIFIGGGTPSLLAAPHIRRITEAVRHSFEVVADPEITLEANPETLSKEKLAGYLEAGVNRLSLGVQSTHSSHLQLMGRGHTPADVREAIRRARQVGFKNLSGDLIFGIPNQTLREWEETLSELFSWNLDHFSAYSLQIEEGTRFGHDVGKGKLTPSDDDLQAEMYERLFELSAENNLRRYEISNFAKPGFESRHNLIYWNNEEYLGFGLGAVSYLNGVRFWNTKNLDRYLSGNELTVGSETLPLEKRVGESLMLGLRLDDGISLSSFRNRFGIDVAEVYREPIERFVDLKLLDKQKDRLKLTPKGAFIANEVLKAFV